MQHVLHPIKEPQDAPAQAQRRAPVLVPGVSEAVPTEGRAAGAPEDAHGHEELRVQLVREDVQPEGEHGDPPQEVRARRGMNIFQPLQYK